MVGMLARGTDQDMVMGGLPLAVMEIVTFMVTSGSSTGGSTGPSTGPSNDLRLLVGPAPGGQQGGHVILPAGVEVGGRGDARDLAILRVLPQPMFVEPRRELGLAGVLRQPQSIRLEPGITLGPQLLLEHVAGVDHGGPVAQGLHGVEEVDQVGQGDSPVLVVSGQHDLWPQHPLGPGRVDEVLRLSPHVAGAKEVIQPPLEPSLLGQVEPGGHLLVHEAGALRQLVDHAHDPLFLDILQALDELVVGDVDDGCLGHDPSCGQVRSPW
jgi:hypothetical protein